MARKCKYFCLISWWYNEFPSEEPKIARAYCCKAYQRNVYKNCANCIYYKPADLDPEWQPFVNELNRRYNNEQ